jgi:hypothetical protein
MATWRARMSFLLSVALAIPAIWSVSWDYWPSAEHACGTAACQTSVPAASFAALFDLPDVRHRPTGQIAQFETEVIEGPADILGNGRTLQAAHSRDFLSRIDIGRFTAPRSGGAANESVDYLH